MPRGPSTSERAPESVLTTAARSVPGSRARWVGCRAHADRAYHPPQPSVQDGDTVLSHEHHRDEAAERSHGDTPGGAPRRDGSLHPQAQVIHHSDGSAALIAHVDAVRARVHGHPVGLAANGHHRGQEMPPACHEAGDHQLATKLVGEIDLTQRRVGSHVAGASRQGKGREHVSRALVEHERPLAGFLSQQNRLWPTFRATVSSGVPGTAFIVVAGWPTDD